METPAMPASATGMSKTRSGPHSLWRPSVTRKTPPRRPTSSPKTSRRSSLRRPIRSAALSAPTIVTSGTVALRVRPAEEVVLGRHGRRDDAGADLTDAVGSLRFAVDAECLVGDAFALEESRVSLDRIELAPRGHVLGRAVAGGVVRGGVGLHPIGHGLDQGR